MTQPITILPVNAVALMLGDLGYGVELPYARSWSGGGLIEALDEFATDNGLPKAVGADTASDPRLAVLPTPLADILYDIWADAGGPITENEGGAMFSGDAAEMLYTLGYYTGPATLAWSTKLDDAYQAWAGDRQIPNNGVVRTGVTGSELEHVSFYSPQISQTLVHNYANRLRDIIAINVGTGAVTAASINVGGGQEPVDVVLQPAPTPESPHMSSGNKVALGFLIAGTALYFSASLFD